MTAILNESIASSSLADDQMEHATVLLNGHHHHGLQNHLPHRFEYNFWNVNYTVEKKNSAPLKILNSACGTLTSGRLTAILGPSGAGKTSMLNVLSAFKASGVTGEFTINGKERRMLQYRKMSSYIPQDFAMLELLTVQETLNVSAHLKLPKETTKQDRCKIIEDIIQMLNMDKCRHTLVRNISGGEQKRLSIGIELVTNPPIMFFDEPTSGLDSVASLQVIKYLRQLALDGRIIVCVVHQPSSNLMKLFDDIIVMSRGEVLYAGSQQKMVPCFENAGFICPSFYNPADFVLEVGSEAHNERSFDLIQKNKEQHFKSRHDNDASENTPLLEYTALDVTISVDGTQTSNGDVASTLPHPQQHRCEAALVRPKSQVGFNTQLYVLMGRSLRSLSRNMISVQLRLLMHIIVGILLGTVFWQIGNDAAKALSNASCLFFVVMFVFFGNAMPSILLCPQDTAVFIREYLNGWYSIKAYYIAKVLADIPMQFACPTVFITIVYLMTGQPEDIGRFVMCWGICLLTAFIGHFIGLVFGSTFNLQMSVFLVPGITIPFMIFSGFFIRIHEVPKFLSFLCDASFFRYTMEGFMQAIYGFNRPDLDCFIDFCYFKSPVKFLKEFDMYGEQYGLDVVALLVWIFALKILFFLSLCYRIKRAV